MSEFLLDASETRPARAAAAPQGRRTIFKPLLIGGVCAAVLAGFAVATSSVMADLVMLPNGTRGPAIDKGLAESWPDLKDGLPAKAGIKVKTAGKAEPPAASGPRMASLPGPLTIAAAAPPPPPAPQPVASRPTPARPTDRIPVATEVAVLTNSPVAKVIAPTRTVAALSPRPSETVHARDEAVRRVEEAAKPREEEEHTREAALEKAAAHTAATRAKTVAAKPAPPEPAKVAAARSAAPKAAATNRTAAADKAAGPKPVASASKPTVTHTATAEPESDETEILGVKLPSLAPAGQKLKDGVSALGDAVRSAF